MVARDLTTGEVLHPTEPIKRDKDGNVYPEPHIGAKVNAAPKEAAKPQPDVAGRSTNPPVEAKGSAKKADG